MIGRYSGIIFNADTEIKDLEETIKKAKARLKYLKEKKKYFEHKYDSEASKRLPAETL